MPKCRSIGLPHWRALTLRRNESAIRQHTNFSLHSASKVGIIDGKVPHQGDMLVQSRHNLLPGVWALNFISAKDTKEKYVA